eukprot:13087805-Alexandrium_andersonii.AAC.1
MSASLVGSEMCIRDRRNPALGSKRGIGARERCIRSSTSEVPQATPGAVSYTHLTLPTICSV